MKEEFRVTEKKLVVDPITGSPMIGKNIDNYEPVKSNLNAKYHLQKNEYFYNRMKYFQKDHKNRYSEGNLDKLENTSVNSFSHKSFNQPQDKDKIGYHDSYLNGKAKKHSFSKQTPLNVKF